MDPVGPRCAAVDQRKVSTGEAYLLLGAAQGYPALHRFRRGDWLAAFQEALFGLRALQRAINRLRQVWREGRYLSVDAAYSLQTIYLQMGEHDTALQLNDWLHERFPSNPVQLYHRAQILEKLGRHRRALGVWQRLIDRILASRQPSD